MDIIKAFKGFDKNLKCRDVQYEIGKEMPEVAGEIKCCKNGYHSCENPLAVFSYYAPGESRFCEVEAGGTIARHDEDSKIASSKIKIGAEISIKSIVEGAIKFIFEKVDFKKGNNTTGDQSGSQATGDRSGSQATGYQSGSQATGDQSGSQATGNQSGSQATGDQSGSQATGDRSMSSVNGPYSKSEIKNTDKIQSKNAVAAAYGCDSMVRAPVDCWLVLAEWDKDGKNIIHLEIAKVDGEKIKADTWYSLKNGKFVTA